MWRSVEDPPPARCVVPQAVQQLPHRGSLRRLHGSESRKLAPSLPSRQDADASDLPRLRIAQDRPAPVDLIVRRLPCGPPPRPARHFEEAWREAHVPTQQPEAVQDPRLPDPHAHARRSRRSASAPPSRAEAALRLIRRVRDRETFEALARARRHRAGPLWLRAAAGGRPDAPAVAYAIGRRTGNAVVRNRIRRRVRAAMRANEALLVHGGAYLVGADASAMTAPFDALCAAVARMLTEAGGR